MRLRAIGYRSLQSCVQDLERHGQLPRVDNEIDPHLEAGAIQRRVYAAGGPALLFTRVKGCRFPMLGNLFGTLERARFLFRDTQPVIEKLVALKLNPLQALKQPFALPGIGLSGLNLLPKTVRQSSATSSQCNLSDLPQLVSWPEDGGAFIILPQVYSEHPQHSGFRNSNLGMYRIQISGNEYSNDEAGLHYQIHRGIGVHHTAALEQGVAGLAQDPNPNRLTLSVLPSFAGRWLVPRLGSFQQAQPELQGEVVIIFDTGFGIQFGGHQ